MAIMGADHLMGVAENPSIASMYHVFSINCADVDLVGSLCGAFTRYSTYNTKSALFRETSPKVLRLMSKKDCSCYTNYELHAKVEEARKLFLQKEDAAFIGELKLLITKISLIENLPLTFDETILYSSLTYSILAIEDDGTLTPDLKRMELRVLLNETCQVLKMKKMADKNLAKELQKLIAELKDIPLLNAAEYRNVKKFASDAFKTQRQTNSGMGNVYPVMCP